MPKNFSRTTWIGVPYPAPLGRPNLVWGFNRWTDKTRIPPYIHPVKSDTGPVRGLTLKANSTETQFRNTL